MQVHFANVPNGPTASAAMANDELSRSRSPLVLCLHFSSLFLSLSLHLETTPPDTHSPSPRFSIICASICVETKREGNRNEREKQKATQTEREREQGRLWTVTVFLHTCLLLWPSLILEQMH